MIPYDCEMLYNAIDINSYYRIFRYKGNFYKSVGTIKEGIIEHDDISRINEKIVQAITLASYLEVYQLLMNTPHGERTTEEFARLLQKRIRELDEGDVV